MFILLNMCTGQQVRGNALIAVYLTCESPHAVEILAISAEPDY